MPAPHPHRKSRVLAWLGRLWHNRRPLRSRRTPLLVELLEDRLTPTTLTDHSGTLNVILDNAGDSLSIAATGNNQYFLSSANSTSPSDLFAAGLTGAQFNAGQLALTTDTAINITDLAAGGSVTFNTGNGTYGVGVTVTLAQPLSNGVTFNGLSTLAHGLTVTTTYGDIVSTNGSSIHVTGDMSLTSNTNITLNGSVTVSGTTTLAANGNIQATGANSFGGGVIVAGISDQAASATLDAGTGVQFTEFQVQGNFTVSAAGPITQGSSPVGSNNVGGTASFTTTSGDILVGSAENTFGGDISASVLGGGNIQIDNQAATTTLGTIHLGTGTLTINDDDFSGTSNITEDSHAAGITASAGAAVTINIINDFTANIDLSTAANNLGSGVHVNVNGASFGSSGDFLLQDVNTSAALSEIAINSSFSNSFSVNSLGILFPQAAAAIDTDNLPASLFSGNLTIAVAGPISQSVTPLIVGGNASFSSTGGDVTIGNTSNSFSGDLSASVAGTANIQLDNSNPTTTLGSITLGSGNFTLNDDDFSGGFGTTPSITEDPNGQGITTATSPPGSPQILINIVNDPSVNVHLDAAANKIASAYDVEIDGQTNSPGGTTGDFGYRSTLPGVPQFTFTNFTLNNLTLKLDNTGDSIDLGSLPAATGNVTVSVGGNITNNSPVSLPGTLTATAGGTISVTAPLTVNGVLAMSSGGDLTQTVAGILGASAATFTVSGAGSNISLTAGNSIPGAVSFNTPATGTGNVAYTGADAVVLGSSSVGNGTFSITAGGAGGISEAFGSTITQGKAAGAASFTAGLTATTIDLLTGAQHNLFTGPVSFNGAAVTTVSLEDTNSLADLSSVSVTGVPNLANLTLRFDGAAASLQLPAKSLAYSLDLIEHNDIVLPVGATLAVPAAGNSLTLESITGSINLFGAVNVSGLLTLQADGLGGPANIQAANPANVIGTLALNNAASGTNTVKVAGTLTLGDSTVAGLSGSLTATALTGSIQQAASTRLDVSVPATFNAPSGNVNLSSPTNTFSVSISANVINPAVTTPNGHTVTLTNSALFTTLGSIALSTGTLTINDNFAATGSTINEDAGSTGIFTQGPVVVNIATDSAANVNLSAAPNLLAAGPGIGAASLTVNGPAGGPATGDFGLRNISPSANLVPISLGGAFTIDSLTLDYDFSSINYNGSLAPSSSGNVTLIAGGGITQTGPIVTSGSASFTISGFIGNASIVLTNPGNNMATGGGATIGLHDQFADNQQLVSLVNQGDINLAASTLGLAAFSLTSSTGNIVSTASITQQAGGKAVQLRAGGDTISLTSLPFSLGNSFYGQVSFTGTGSNGLTVIGFENNNPLAALPALSGLAATGQSSITYDLRNAPVMLGNVNTKSLSVTAGGNITQAANTSLVVIGEASVNAGGNGIQLTAGGNNIAEVSLANSGPNAVSLTTAGAVVLDALALGSGPLTITATGAITETAGAGLQQSLGNYDSVAGPVTFKTPGNPVLLDNPANQFVGALAATASALTAANAGNVTLGNDAISGALTVVAPTGTITQAPGSTIRITGSVFLSSGGGGGALDSISVTNPGNTIAGPVSISSSGGGAALAVYGPVELAASSIAGLLTVQALSPNQITAPADITQSMQPSGALNALGASFTSANQILLANPANDFNGQQVGLSAGAGITFTDSDAGGLTLGQVSFGNAGLALTASGDVTQAFGAMIGTGPVAINAASTDPTKSINVSLTQSGNNVTSPGGTFALTNVNNVAITNAGSILLTGGSTIAKTANVSLTAGGAVSLPTPNTGTLTLGSLTVSANQIQLGNLGVNLTTTAGGIQVTGAVVFQHAMTLDTSAAGFGGSIFISGNVIDGPNQPLTINLPSQGRLDFNGGTWTQGNNQGSSNVTVTGASVNVTINGGATLAMNGGTFAITGAPAGGGSPSTGNNLNVFGTLQVAGTATISDGGPALGVDSVVTVNLAGTLSVGLGSPNSLLTLSGQNASDHIAIGGSARLYGFGGSASTGPVLSVTGGGSISGTFANPQDSTTNGNFLMGTDIVSAAYAASTVTIQPTDSSVSVPIGAESDGDLYAVSVTGGTGLVVAPITTGGTPGLAIVVRNATAATTLTIKTTANGGDGFTSVVGIAMDGGGAATIAAGSSNLTGNIAIVGPLTSLTVNNWSNGTLSAGPSLPGVPVVTSSITGNVLTADTINLQTQLATLTANQVTGSFGAFGLGTITAASFGTITIGSKKSTVPANFFTNLVNTTVAASPALKTATIGGTMTGNWDLNGAVGSVTAGATTTWNLGRPGGPGVLNSGQLSTVSSLTLGSATDVGLLASGNVGSITAIGIDNRLSNATLEAGSFGTITTTGTKKLDNGNFFANLLATSSVSKTGALGGLTVAGNIGTVAQPFTLQFLNGNVGTISAGASVQNVTITAVTTNTSGAISTINAAAWNNANLTATSVSTWKIAANFPALLPGAFTNSVITLLGTAGVASQTLGTFSATGDLDGNTFDVVAGSVGKFTVGGIMSNDVVAVQSATVGSIGTIAAADWQGDMLSAMSIGTLQSVARAAAPAATSGLLGNITDSTIVAFGGGLATFQAAGNVTASAVGLGYLIANGQIGTFSAGRAVNGFQVSTNLNGGQGGIGTLNAGQWINSDLATFSLGSVTISGFVSPDQLAGFTPGNFDGSAVVVTGAATNKGTTSGIGQMSIGGNLDNDTFNVPRGIATLGVTGTIGATGPDTLDLLNPSSPGASNLGTLTAGAIQSLTLYVNQAGSITTTGNAVGLNLAVGFGTSVTGTPNDIATLSIGGNLSGGTITVQEGIGKFTVAGAYKNGSLAAAYDQPGTGIGTMILGSCDSVPMAIGSVSMWSIAGKLESSRITILGTNGKGAGIDKFTAGGQVYQCDLQVTGGNVNSFQCSAFVNSGLFLGYRLVDPLTIIDPLNNQAASNWEGNFKLGSFKTTAVLNTATQATRAATAGFQTSDVVAASLGTISLSGVSPIVNIPPTIKVNGVAITVPQVLLTQAAFGVGFRQSGGTAATKFTIAGNTVSVGFGTGAFVYTALNG
jgi:hypothetical protein